MKKLFLLITCTIFCSAIMISCGAKRTKIMDLELTKEKMIWSSSPSRPEWTMEESDQKSNNISFVGISGKYATEQAARDDAYNNAINNVVKYLGTMAKNKIETARVSYGLESSVVDATKAGKSFEKQLSANVASRLKAKKWYLEKWSTETGVGWKVFVQAQIPQESIDDSFKKSAADNMAEAQGRAKEAANDIARRQAEMSAEFWKQMKDQGLTE